MHNDMMEGGFSELKMSSISYWTLFAIPQQGLEAEEGDIMLKFSANIFILYLEICVCIY